jgi:hypothetical protein
MAQDPNEKLEKEGNTTKGNMGEGRLSIDAIDKLLKRGKYAPTPKSKSEPKYNSKPSPKPKPKPKYNSKPSPKPKTEREKEFEGLFGKNSKKKMEAAELRSALTADAMKMLKSFPEPKPNSNSKPFQGLPLTEAIKAGRAGRAGRAAQVPAAQMHTMPDGTKMKGAKHGMKHGGAVKGKCRMDGIAIRGKTRAKERSK